MIYKDRVTINRKIWGEAATQKQGGEVNKTHEQNLDLKQACNILVNFYPAHARTWRLHTAILRSGNAHCGVNLIILSCMQTLINMNS